MVISRELDYTIRILRCIADGSIHAIGKICDSERIPRQVANKILTKLQEAEMISCTRGRHGGCRLTMDLKSITIFDLMKVTGNECSVNLCLVPKSVCVWQETHRDVSQIHKTLATFQDEVNDRLKKTNVYSIIHE